MAYIVKQGEMHIKKCTLKKYRRFFYVPLQNEMYSTSEVPITKLRKEKKWNKLKKNFERIQVMLRLKTTDPNE